MLSRLAPIVLLAFACSPPPPPVDAGVPTEADSPLAKRFLADMLPWPVSPDATSRGLSVTAGINAQPQLREPRYRPIAVSADVLAVVFPPADKAGFDVAFGGFEKPWQREPLTSIRANQVASLDALADGSGGAWVAMRLLDRTRSTNTVAAAERHRATHRRWRHETPGQNESATGSAAA